MTTVLAIDPGSERSAWLRFDGTRGVTPGDADTYTIPLDPNQTATVRVTSTAARARRWSMSWISARREIVWMSRISACC